MTTPFRRILTSVALGAMVLVPAMTGQQRPRARDLGVPFEGTPGPLNAITDVAGVTVGHATIISGDGPLVVGKGPVRTGVTAVLPRGRDTLQRPCFGAWFSLNGNGEMTGTTWVEESGFLEGPVLITNTHSVGVVRDAAIAWRLKAGRADASGFWWTLPVVAETWDGYLNDINGMHVKPEHAFQALDRAAGLLGSLVHGWAHLSGTAGGFQPWGGAGGSRGMGMVTAHFKDLFTFSPSPNCSGYYGLC